jgi:hypothetical protein
MNAYSIYCHQPLIAVHPLQHSTLAAMPSCFSLGNHILDQLESRRCNGSSRADAAAKYSASRGDLLQRNKEKNI